jgi:hypothetical protein
LLGNDREISNYTSAATRQRPVTATKKRHFLRGPYHDVVSRTLGEKKTLLSSEKMLHKDHDRKGSVAKKSLVVILKGFGAKAN